MNRLLTYILLTVTLALTGCGSDDTIVADAPMVPKDNLVRLRLSVSIVDPTDPYRSRALPEDYGDYDFEPPVTEYEKINTLRIFIVDRFNNIEATMYTSLDNVYDYLTDYFEVVGGEEKDVWLIANEASVPYDFAALKVGNIFPDAAVRAIQLTSGTTGPVLYDNTGTNKIYLPMSEMFSVFVKRPKTDDDLYQTAQLFITRSTVKFSFTFKSDGPIDASYNVAAVKFKGLGNKQFFIPRSTEYYPAKYPISAVDRVITRYTTPNDATLSEYLFNLPGGGYPLNSALRPENANYSPELYFPETTSSELVNDKQKYYATVGLKDLSNPSAALVWFDYVGLDNLPSLPRNTHVVINFTLTGSQLDAVVDVLPYTGVWLNPDFGIWRPGNPNNPKGTV